MILKGKSVIIYIVVIMLLLCGCTANRELDEQSIVGTVCFSYEDDFIVTAEVLTEDATENKLVTKTHSAKGKTPEKAVMNLSNNMPKRAMFDHCAAIVLSDKMNKKKQMEALEFCVKNPTINLGTPVVYCSEPQSLLKCKSENIAVGYDIIIQLKVLSLERQSRLYKTAQNLRGIEHFENKNGELTHIDKKS